MNKKHSALFIVAIIIITAVITFLLTSFLYTGSAFFNPTTGMKYQKIDKAVNILKNDYLSGVDDEQLINGALTGMVQTLGDPYTNYLYGKDLEDFLVMTDGEFSGIGVYVSVDPSDNLITVISSIDESPAQEAGLVSGDKIVKVDGEEVNGDNLDGAVAKIKGEEDTNVTLTIKRGTEAAFDVTLTRGVVTVKSVKSELLEGNIGLIRISVFEKNTVKEVEDAVQELQNQNAQSFIIDLRDNPGGLLNVCVDICDMFLPECTIVYTQDKNGNKETQYSDSDYLDMPIVLLVNNGSASASEIMSGALRDNGRAKIVGTKTFGKGLVQTVKPLDQESALKVTISEYYTPNGVQINKVGLMPDELIELPDKWKETPAASIPREEDTQLQKAIELLQ